MKIIDKTPFQTEKGEISLVDRLQGTLKYGFSWYAELEAQKTVIAQLDRVLEKGAALVRNMTLPGSEIVEPIILIAQSGIYLIHVTHLRGFYEAKGDQWNIVNSGQPQPAPINLISRSVRYARALGRYLQIQNIDLPVQVEPVLIAADPGMHIESNRPAVRVVQSDAIKQFATSIMQARPVLRTELVYDVADRIVNPRPKSELTPQPAPPPAAAPQAASSPAAPDPATRAHAIFNASDQSQPFNPSDLSFAFQEEGSQQPQAVPQNLRESNPAQPLPRPQAKKGGISPAQGLMLGLIALVECCMLAGFGYLIFFNK